MTYQTNMFMVDELKKMSLGQLREIFREAFMTKEHLIKGDLVCICDRTIHAHAKSMDKRLVQLMKMIVDHLAKENKQLEDSFDVGVVYGDSHKLISDFSKLHCWKLVERVGNRVNRFTDRGLGFLFGEIQIPRRVWVYNDRGDRSRRIIIEDDEMVNVGNVDDRWQTQRSDYTFDYVNVRFNKAGRIKAFQL